MVRVRYMKDNLILLTPREGERIDNIIKLKKDWFDSVFRDFKPWSDSLAASHRLIWVRCYGLPLSLWNKDCLSKVVGEVATLVSIDDGTVLWENLEYARIQVRTRKSSSASLTKKL